MSFIEVVILGLVQGLTEFLPVSSSGHLLLIHKAFGNTSSTLAFDVALHVGTVIALLVYFRKELIDLAMNLFSKTVKGRLARLLIWATLPAAILGLLLSDYIDKNLRTPIIVASTLAGVGILMLIAEAVAKKLDNKEVSTKQGMTVGFAQALALIPGVSRSGITITTGLFMGMSRVEAARFSFLLAIPIIAGSAFGTLLKGSYDHNVILWQVLLGASVSFVSGLLAIKFFLGVIDRVGLKPFAIYRIALALLVLAILV